MFHFLHHPLHLPLHLFHLPLSRSLCHFPLLFSFLVGLMAIFRNPITLMFGLVQLVAEEEEEEPPRRYGLHRIVPVGTDVNWHSSPLVD